MEKMLDVAGEESSKYVTRQKYPHISQLVASSIVGKVTKDRNLCKSLFPCNDEIKNDVQVSFSVKLHKKVITETNRFKLHFNLNSITEKLILFHRHGSSLASKSQNYVQEYHSRVDYVPF